MKLLYCEILTFGNLKNMRVDLRDGLNVFLRENGWGKTTFCAFIKDMLYGIGEKRTKSIAENDRIKYEPWSGGTFGGSLGFEQNGKRYRIERTFGKTPAQDTFRVYDEQTKMLTCDFSAYGDKIGEALFGIDRDAFERAVFFASESNLPLPIDGDLKNALCRAITDSRGEDVDGAIECIESAERELKAKRRPAQGLIDQTEDELLRLRGQLRRLEENLLSLPTIERQITQLDGTVSALNEKIDGCMTELSMRGESNDAAVGQALKAQLQMQIDDIKTQLSALSAFFNGQDPNQLNFSALKAQTEEYYQRKRAQEESQAQTAERDRQLLEMQSLTERKQELEHALQNYRLAMQEKGEDIPTQPTPSKGKGIGLILFFLSVCLLIVGTLFFKTNVLLASCLFGGGALLFFISVAIAKKIKSKGAGTRSNANSALQTAYLQTLSRLKECQTRLDEIKGIDGQEPTPIYEQEKAALMQLQQSLHGYFSAFGFDEIYDFRAALQTLMEKTQTYQTLQYALSQKRTQLQALPKQEENTVVNGYQGYTPAQSLKAELLSLQRQKEETLKQKHALQATHDELLLCKIEAEELLEEEKILLEKHARLTCKLAALQTAKSLLIQAKNNLSDRYLTPVANACKQYLSAFGEKPFDICFDGSGAPLLKDSGFYRQPDFYSQGYRRVIDFCIRLAVVQTVYQTSQTPLIFDDPFTELDDKHLQAAKQFLTSLAKTRQIVYFTCSPTRAL